MTDDVIFIPPFQTPAKPKYGSPCNGCGWCCHEQVCSIGVRVFKTTTAPCPGIEYQDGKVRCGVVLAEEAMIKEGLLEGNQRVKTWLGVDKGCDAIDEESGIL